MKKIAVIILIYSSAFSLLHSQTSDSLRLADDSCRVDKTAKANDTNEIDSVSNDEGPSPFFPKDSESGEVEEGFMATDTVMQPFAAESTITVDSAVLPPRLQPDSGRVASMDSTAQQAPARPSWLYCGLSLEQDQLARLMLYYYYQCEWSVADKIGKKLQRLEKKSKLPPLGSLLMVGMRVLRIQNGEYENDHAKKNLLRDIDKISKKGLDIANPDKAPDSVLTTALFITGGIKGFLATLEIENNPINAALNGFSAFRVLEKAAQRDTSMYDVFLGLGLFNCLLAKAPLLVRGALNIVGMNVSFSQGIAFLEQSANHGCYTNDIAKLFLIEFLSPYLGNEAKEKQRYLRSLQKSYPANPFFVFLELEENLCFHPAVLTNFSYKQRIRKQIMSLAMTDISSRRYANLVKWQYLLINPFPTEGIAPDTAINLGPFSYYPVFLQALGEKFLLLGEPEQRKSDRQRRLHYIKAQQTVAARMLDAAEGLPAKKKDLFQWHIRDALRTERAAKK